MAERWSLICSSTNRSSSLDKKDKFNTVRKFLSSSGLRLVFFKSGRTTVDLNRVGKMPEEREVFITLTIAGSAGVCQYIQTGVWPEGDQVRRS